MPELKTLKDIEYDEISPDNLKLLNIIINSQIKYIKFDDISKYQHKTYFIRSSAYPSCIKILNKELGFDSNSKRRIILKE